MFRKISWELTATYILLIMFPMIILGVFLLSFFELYFINNTRQDLYHQAQLIAEGWPRSVNLREPTLRESRFYWDLIDRLSLQTGSRIRILSDRGVPIYDTGSDEEPELDLPIQPEIKKALIGKPQEGENHNSYTQSYPIIYHGPTPGDTRLAGVVYISRSKKYLKTIIGHVNSQFYLVFFISVLLSIILALLFSHHLTKPIVDMTRQADLMSRGDLNQKVKVKTGNEIGQLSEKFNIMAEKLQGTLNQLTGEKNKLAAIINNMAGGVMVIDDRWRIVMVNRTAFHLLGLRQTDILDKKINKVIPGHSLLRLLEDSNLEKEVRISLDELPEDRAVDATITPLLAQDDSPMGAVIIMNDVTEFHRLDRMRAEFVSNVSHELKTPLACIKGLSELLIDGALNEDRATEFLESINREVDRLTRLVKDLLDLSKMESGMVKIDLHPVNMEETVKQVITRLVPQARKKSIELIADLNCPTPALANMDRVQQVMINLIDNAVRYTPEEGRIYVKLQEKDPANCLVEVADTGPGISGEDLQLIFERFYRADRSRSRGEGGFGLGLAITKQIVENMDGTIKVSSTPPDGTSFFFTLPLINDEQ